jgi:hypothetical protein
MYDGKQSLQTSLHKACKAPQLCIAVIHLTAQKKRNHTLRWLNRNYILSKNPDKREISD